MNKKLNVAILGGGPSSEYEVSKISQKAVWNNIDKNKYHVKKYLISKDDNNTNKIINDLKQNNTDVVFIAMHGTFGEDGQIQRLLDKAGLKYTGSDYKASKLGMDKVAFQKVMLKNKVTIPRCFYYKKGKSVGHIEKVLGPLPYFVKPSKQGSSVGISKAHTKDELDKSIELALKYDQVVIIEEFVQGKELTVAIIGNDNLRSLPIIEIIPENDFFDYKSKYSSKVTQEICPAKLDKNISEKVVNIAEQVYKLVGCKGFARVDFILNDNITPVVLEINTIPGLTPMSLFPKAAKAAGISYTELINKIISYAI